MKRLVARANEAHSLHGISLHLKSPRVMGWLAQSRNRLTTSVLWCVVSFGNVEPSSDFARSSYSGVTLAPRRLAFARFAPSWVEQLWAEKVSLIISPLVVSFCLTRTNLSQQLASLTLL